MLDLPRLGTYPLISRLIEELGRESSPWHRMNVTLKFPSSVSLAELWPDHSEYFNETRKKWVVSQKQGRIKMRPRSSGSDSATYLFATDPSVKRFHK
ncbi:hypothetical protein AAVH_35500 [Aphelenchoides avenae]|nr:hypothetical protein AAVH_35500 [Aphelenchus avenae]